MNLLLLSLMLCTLVQYGTPGPVKETRGTVECDADTAGQFRCTSGGCIDESFICDFENDCPDGEDEQNCLDTPCKGERFKCSQNGKCIWSSWVCDGETDCPDGEEEQICEDFRPEFECPSTVQVKLGQQFEIRCPVRAYPLIQDLKILWQKSSPSDSSVPSAEYSADIEDGKDMYEEVMILRIEKVEKDHLGRYNFIAKNNIGTAIHVVRLEQGK